MYDKLRPLAQILPKNPTLLSSLLLLGEMHPRPSSPGELYFVSPLFSAGFCRSKWFYFIFFRVDLFVLLPISYAYFLSFFQRKVFWSAEWRINIELFLLFRPVPLPITLFPYSDTQTRSGIDWRKLWPPNERDRPLYSLAIRSIMALFRCRSGDENSVIFMVLVELPISIWGETFLFAPLSVKLNKF